MCSGSERCEGCPQEMTGTDCKGESIAGAIERKLNEDIDEKRMIFVGSLYAKAETAHLKRIEALIILQATLAEMLVPTIVGLKEEEANIEPGSIARANAAIMVEIAEELRVEALRVVDHAMANSRLIVVPR